MISDDDTFTITSVTYPIECLNLRFRGDPEPIISICSNGQVIISNMEIDEAAKKFWEAVADNFPLIKRMIKES